MEWNERRAPLILIPTWVQSFVRILVGGDMDGGGGGVAGREETRTRPPLLLRSEQEGSGTERAVDTGFLTKKSL